MGTAPSSPAAPSEDKVGSAGAQRALVDDESPAGREMYAAAFQQCQPGLERVAAADGLQERTATGCWWRACLAAQLPGCSAPLALWKAELLREGTRELGVEETGAAVRSDTAELCNTVVDA